MVRVENRIKVILGHNDYESTISGEAKSLIKFNLHPNSSQYLGWFWLPESGREWEEIDTLEEPITGNNIQMERDMFLNSPAYAYNVLYDAISNVFFASEDGHSRLDQLAISIMHDSRKIIRSISSNKSVDISMEIQVVAAIAIEKEDMMKYLKKRRVADNSTEESCCPICLENFMSKSACLTPCSHPFHEDCIAQWLQSNYRCPMCRFEIIQEVMGELFLDEGEEDIAP